jgi:hypothetical protein
MTPGFALMLIAVGKGVVLIKLAIGLRTAHRPSAHTSLATGLICQRLGVTLIM